jgi:hypothetical protein
MKAQIPVTPKSDSVYTKIDQFSEDKKLFKFLHKIMFRSSNTTSSNNNKTLKNRF